MKRQMLIKDRSKNGKGNTSYLTKPRQPDILSLESSKENSIGSKHTYQKTDNMFKLL